MDQNIWFASRCLWEVPIADKCSKCKTSEQFSLWFTRGNTLVDLWKCFPTGSSQQMRYHMNLALILSFIWSLL